MRHTRLRTRVAGQGCVTLLWPWEAPVSRYARLSLRFAIVLSALVTATPAAAADDPFTMTATSYASGYSPAYVGNGYVGTRVPAQGMGFVDGAAVPTTTIAAGYGSRRRRRRS